jgi:hypothetical protein
MSCAPAFGHCPGRFKTTRVARCVVRGLGGSSMTSGSAAPGVPVVLEVSKPPQPDTPHSAIIPRYAPTPLHLTHMASDPEFAQIPRAVIEQNGGCSQSVTAGFFQDSEKAGLLPR